MSNMSQRRRHSSNNGSNKSTSNPADISSNSSVRRRSKKESRKSLRKCAGLWWWQDMVGLQNSEYLFFEGQAFMLQNKSGHDIYIEYDSDDKRMSFERRLVLKNGTFFDRVLARSANLRVLNENGRVINHFIIHPGRFYIIGKDGESYTVKKCTH